MQTTLQIQGMHCASCKKLIESVSKDVPGVQSCEVDFTTGKATLTHDESMDLNKVKEEIRSLGEYTVESI